MLSVELDGLLVEIFYRSATSYALAHNRIPVIDFVFVTAKDEYDPTAGTANIRIRAPFEGAELFEPVELSTSSLTRGDERYFDLRTVSRVRPEDLSRYNESVVSELQVTLRQDECSATAAETLRILAPDEWFNDTPYFESLAAFVQPNDPGVVPVLNDASRILEKETGSSSIQGYQAGSNRAIEIAAAIFEALRAHEIRYINPPASFEKTGQRIRSSSQVLSEQLGTCIDLSLTFCAVAEQAGLHPVVILLPGHAMTGILTSEQVLPRPVLFDPSEIHNYIMGGLLVPIDAVCFCHGKGATFADAVNQAKRILERSPGEGAISIADARRDGMRPLPMYNIAQEPRLNDDDGTFAENRVSWDVSGLLTDEGFSPDTSGDSDGETVPARIQQWKKELLDLSQNNRLLNLGSRSDVLDLVLRPKALAELDDLIHSGDKITLLPVDDISDNRRLQGIDSARELPDEVILDNLTEHHRVFVDTGEKGYRTKFKSLQRTVRTLQEETGSSNLFLTFGSLRYPRKDGKTTEAPLFLIPVRIVGGSGNSRFQIVVDSTQTASTNYSLIEWLRQMHSVNLETLADPPRDASGLDINRALSQISQELIAASLPFTVVERASIIIAKFSTYGMWKDLNTSWETFIDSPVFRHIALDPGKEFKDPAGTAPLEDTQINEAELALPIPADGAQLQAITAAAEGRSFVLEGPPGTGKSQTITNLIAHCLDRGKTVLFVAEKQAALQVVKGRLERVGLSPFTLDLHGTDQHPDAIRSQLIDSIDANFWYDLRSWDTACTNLKARLEPLQKYPGMIHVENASGYSLWSAASAAVECGEGPRARFPASFVRNPTLDRDTVSTLFRTLGEQTRLVNADERTRWSLTSPNLSEMTDEEFTAAWSDLETALKEVIQRPLIQELVTAGLDLEDVAAAVRALETIPSYTRLSPEQRATADTVPTSLRDTAQDVTQLNTETATLTSAFSVTFLSEGDVQTLRDAAEQSQKGLRRKKKKLRYEELLRAAVPINQISNIDIEAQHAPEHIIPLLLTVPAFRAAAERVRQQIASLPLVDDLATISPLEPALAGQLEQRAAHIDHQLTFASEWPIIFDRSDVEISGLADALDQVSQAWRAWLVALGADSSSVHDWQGERNWLEAWIATADEWRNDIQFSGPRTARRATDWRRTAEALRRAELEALVEQQINDPVEATESDMAVLRGLAGRSILERSAEFDLEDFDGSLKERHLAQLQEAVDRVRQEALSAIPARLLQRRKFKPGHPDNETGQLRRLLEAKRNARSFRTLLKEFPEQILDVTPCFFVSPASLATFVEPGAVTFDVVVFDEASQVPVDQAVGALGRGRSAVIVGDSQQLPPTRVAKVSAALSEDEYVDSDEAEQDPMSQLKDLESILEEAVASHLPRLWLTWHYRSQNESLIAFSNQQYYDGKLASLPSPGGLRGAGVSFRRIEGQFQRRKGEGARTNQAEADAIVEEIIRRLNNPATFNESIGVVTFNLQQMNLILNMLENHPDPMLREKLRPGPDSLFVKNLENVQGDERDVILFSVAFSKNEEDPEGPLPLNFGPLTRKGGEKRLNVAVTRARKSVIVFASFDPSDINLERTTSQGLADLRSYMELAAQGTGTLAPPSSSMTESNRLRDELALQLRERGWIVETDFGLSSFTIDLVVRPSEDDRWHVAVLMDGPKWSSLSTVADRDLTPGLLKPMMHWAETVRVWLPELLTDPLEVVDRIELAVRAAQQTIAADDERHVRLQEEAELQLARKREELEEQATAEKHARQEAMAELAGTDGDDVDPTELQEIVDDKLGHHDLYEEAIPLWHTENETIPLWNGQGNDAEVDAETIPMRLESQETTQRNAADSEICGPDWVVFNPIEIQPLGDKEELEAGLTLERRRAVSQVVKEMIDEFGPLPLQKLRVTVAQCFGRQRTSAKLNQNIDQLIPHHLIHTEGSDTQQFAWPSGYTPENCDFVQDSQGERTIQDIPLREIANAMKLVLIEWPNFNGTEPEDREILFRETLEIFGLSRLQGKARQRLEETYRTFNTEF